MNNQNKDKYYINGYEIKYSKKLNMWVSKKNGNTHFTGSLDFVKKQCKNWQ